MYLDSIIAFKRTEIEEFKKIHSCKDFEKEITLDRGDLFFTSLKQGSISIIAEIKKASPSMGVICEDFKPLEIARSYVENGASAISILTDKEFFQGDIEYLRQIREITGIPLLRKDFVIDEIQILEAKAAGANAILLIKAALDDNRLKELINLANDVACAPLVEVHTIDEMNASVDAGAFIIGVNNRNLQTFEVDLDNSRRILPLIPKSCLRISESGIKTKEEIQSLRKSGADAFLIGTSFMQSENKRKLFEDLSL